MDGGGGWSGVFVLAEEAAGLGDFVRGSVDEYVEYAISLAGSRAMLTDLRRRMRGLLRDAPVCDTTEFARNMERIYCEMCGLS